MDLSELARRGEEPLRTGLGEWLEKHRQPELDGLDGWALYENDGHGEPTIGDVFNHQVETAYRRWEEDLAKVGLICPHWDVEFGGLGFGPVEMSVVDVEFGRARMPRVLRGMGEAMVGPTLIRHGSAEQQRRYLPAIITGKDRWCQGFSEPNSGSDLASLKTRAVVEGDELVIDGQKVWTSGASRANMIFLLCRTDPRAAKHRGITYVVMPMDTEGIEIRPIRQMNGTSEFFETFLSGARAPVTNVVGGMNNGWHVAMSTLEHERTNLFTEWSTQFERDVQALIDQLREEDRLSSPLDKHKVVDLVIQSRLLTFHRNRLLDAARSGRSPGPIQLLSKLLWSEAQQRLGEVALELTGPTSMIRPDGPGYAVTRWQDIFLFSRGLTLAAGTSEIQRNIIAERGLGLPREKDAVGNEPRRPGSSS